MSSGFSFSGGRPRCFVYWQELQKCYIQTDNPTECRPQGGDYLECLHHTKEKKRVEAIQNELLRREQLAKDAAKKQGHGHAE